MSFFITGQLMKRFFLSIIILIPYLWSMQIHAITARYSGEKRLIVELKTPKSEYQVGEQITFSVSSNLTFYLYLFSFHSNHRMGYQILPNELQPFTQYQGHRTYTIPQKNVVFSSQHPGIEKIYMLASTEELEIPKTMYKPSGIYYAARSDALQRMIQSLYNHPQNGQVVYKEVLLTIHDPNHETAQQIISKKTHHKLNDIAVFVSSNQRYYEINDNIKITFGADHAGVVTLLLMNHKGDQSILKMQRVSGYQFYQVNAIAISPPGDYFIVALYDHNDQSVRELFIYSFCDKIIPL